MITVKDRHTGATHSGRSPETIARRLFGRRAYVWYSGDPNSPWQAYACTPGPLGGSDIEADWYLDEDARAAAEPEL